jgi:hypothetical protein
MTTLAERNRNPLNLRPLPNGEKWQGQIGVDRNSVTGAFCVFDTNVKGVRAAVVNMRSYVKYSGVKTIADVIYRWAPPPRGGITGTAGSAVDGVDQNHTEAYIASVCAETGLPRTFDVTPLTLTTTAESWRGKMVSIVRAMNRVEAGKSTITVQEAMDGVNEALNVPKGYVRQDDGNIVREHMAQSETIKLNDKGQTVNVIGTGVSAVTALSVIQDWKVALIVAGLIVATGIGAGVYFYFLRKDRKQMNEANIA